MRMRKLIAGGAVFIVIVCLVAWWTVTPVGALPTQWSEIDYGYMGQLVAQHYVNCSEPVHSPWWGDTSQWDYKDVVTGACSNGIKVGGETCFVCYPDGSGGQSCQSRAC